MDDQLPALAPVGSLPAPLRAGLEAAYAYAKRNRAPTTRAGYLADYRLFEDWCRANKLDPMPASVAAVGTYMAIEATRGIRPATLSRRLAAIAFTHREQGHTSPTADQHIRDIIAGIRNSSGTAPTARKAAATHDKLATMLATIPVGTLAGIRDRALLTLGFAAALRRSELVALAADDLEEVPDGLLVYIAASKTDQAGAGCTIAVPRGYRLRPVEAVQAWLDASGLAGTSGPLFRAINKAGRLGDMRLTGRTVADLIKRYAQRAGLDPAEFSGHSLRAGFITNAATHGATVWKMQAVSRHKTLDVLSGYVRDADAFKDHAGQGFL